MSLGSVDRDQRGVIFDIQRFSVHDGPGIRTTVFMKGCPLRCLWCSNPESQDPAPNVMALDTECRRCGTCVGVCPSGSITLSEERGREIDWRRCEQCLLCAEKCLYGGLTICGRTIAMGEILDEVERDEAFYRNSGGGVTVSGGEPLSQPAFVAALLQACKRRGWRTALDTSGYAAPETLGSVLPHADLVLFDVKHLDSKEHERATGVGNALILENLQRTVGAAAIWLRIPLVAGFNDSPDHIEAVACLARDLGAEKVSLLPYHDGGRSKCRQLGRPYPLPEGRAPEHGHVHFLTTVLEREGLRVSVGS